MKDAFNKIGKKIPFKMFGAMILLLMALSGVASAWEVSGTIAENGQAPVSGQPFTIYGASFPTYIVHEGQPFQVGCQITDLTLLRDATFQVSFWDTPGYVYLGFTSPRVSADSSGNAIIQIPSLSVLTPATTPYRVYIQYQGWDDTYTHNYAYNGNVYLYVIPNTPDTPTSVPEFPSVAIPVAAILGLVVIFGRRKNMV